MFGYRLRSAVILVACLLLASSLPANAQKKILGSQQNLDWPWDLVVDPSGRLFVAGIESHNVIRFTPPRDVVTRVTPSAGLDHPRWLAVDPTGIVYVSDGDLVLKIPEEGPSTPISFGAYDVEFMAADGAGNVFATDGTVVFKREPGGAITELFDRSGLGGNWLDRAYDVEVADSGDVFVVGEESDNVFKITPGNVITEIIDATGDGTNPLDSPTDAAVDAAGNVYVSGSGSNNAFKITPGGVITQLLDSTGDGLGNTLSGPSAIAVAPGGNVYVSGRTNVFRITPGGVVTEIIDSTGDGMGNELVTGSKGALVLDSNESVFVAGQLSRNVFRVTLGGAITEIIDETADGQPGIFFSPRGLAVDSADNIFVTGWGGTLEGYAFVITPAGAITELAGPSGDGAGNTLRPGAAIGVDSSGTVTISTESYPYNVFQVSPGGAVSLLVGLLSFEFPLYQGGQSLAVASDGTVYLAGYTSDNVWKLETGGAKTEIINSNGDGTGQPWLGEGPLAASPEGDVYVIGFASNNVFKIPASGSVSEIINIHGDLAGNQLRNPTGIALDAAGNVYVCGAGSDNAFKIEPSGAITQILDGTGDGLGNELDDPWDLATSAAGDVFVLGSTSVNAFHISPEGQIREIIDADGDGEGNTLAYVTAIAASPDGLRAYVGDDYSNTNGVFMIYLGPPMLPVLNAPLGLLLAVILAASGQAFVFARRYREAQETGGRDAR